MLIISHNALPAGHPRITRIVEGLRPIYSWPHMAAECTDTVEQCLNCERNQFQLRRRTSKLRLFAATSPFDAVEVDLIGTLPETSGRNRFLLVPIYRLT